MLRWRNANKLCTWIEAATASHFRFLAQFANTLRRDLKAVELSITTPWSNGPIEGHINRLKAIKRQMYGRAGFELLKARVLPWDVPQAALAVHRKCGRTDLSAVNQLHLQSFQIKCSATIAPKTLRLNECK